MNTPLVLGPLVPFMEEFTTPAWVEVDGQRFAFDAQQECYPGIYLEPTMSDGTLTEDAYYEIESQS